MTTQPNVPQDTILDPSFQGVVDSLVKAGLSRADSTRVAVAIVTPHAEDTDAVDLPVPSNKEIEVFSTIAAEWASAIAESEARGGTADRADYLSTLYREFFSSVRALKAGKAVATSYHGIEAASKALIALPPATNGVSRSVGFALQAFLADENAKMGSRLFRKLGLPPLSFRAVYQFQRLSAVTSHNEAAKVIAKLGVKGAHTDVVKTARVAAIAYSRAVGLYSAAKVAREARFNDDWVEFMAKPRLTAKYRALRVWDGVKRAVRSKMATFSKLAMAQRALAAYDVVSLLERGRPSVAAASAAASLREWLKGVPALNRIGDLDQRRAGGEAVRRCRDTVTTVRHAIAHWIIDPDTSPLISACDVLIDALKDVERAVKDHATPDDEALVMVFLAMRSTELITVSVCSESAVAVEDVMASIANTETGAATSDVFARNLYVSLASVVASIGASVLYVGYEDSWEMAAQGAGLDITAMPMSEAYNASYRLMTYAADKGLTADKAGQTSKAIALMKEGLGYNQQDVPAWYMNSPGRILWPNTPIKKQQQNNH